MKTLSKQLLNGKAFVYIAEDMIVIVIFKDVCVVIPMIKASLE